MSRAVSLPIPVLAPVITTVLPEMSLAFPLYIGPRIYQRNRNTEQIIVPQKG